MNLHWLGYALKVTALINIGAGLLNLLIENYSWATGNFTFAIVLWLSSSLATQMFGGFVHEIKPKKKPWRPYD
jgi:hypothetical protein